MKYSLSLKDFPGAQCLFHCVSRLKSQYRHFQLQLQHFPSWRSILEKLVLRIAPTAGQYGEILPIRALNFNIILFSKGMDI